MSTTTIRATVKPDAHRDRLVVDSAGVFSITVKEPATGNRANERVREMLAHHFKLPNNHIRLIAGRDSPRKRFSISRV